jgi:hypothetical protein
MTLAETQSRFYALATRDPAADLEWADACLAGTAELEPRQRLQIYADMYLWRQVDALREDYPKLAALLGNEAFCRLGEAYVRAHPSEHPDLGQLGRHLAAFLRARPDLAPRQDLADLAALEWARSEVFFETAAEPVGPAALAAIPPESFPGVRLRLIPALRILVLEHDAALVWSQLEAGSAAGPPEARPAAAAVWRSGFDVFHAAVDLDEAVALAGAAAGDPLSRVCAAFARRESPAESAFEAIRSWLDEGWIAGLEPPGGPPAA